MKSAIKAKAEKRSLIDSIKKRSPLYVMLIPGVLYLIMFNYLPMFGMILSFKKINFRDGILGSAWCGFDNFRYALSSPSLLTALKNTILYNIVFLFIGMALSILLAIMLDLLWGKLSKKVYQTIMIMPYFLSWVIVSYLVFGFLSMESGVVNNTILPLFGMDKINWYMEPKYWPAILIIVYFWKNWGYSSILYTSALSGVDVQLYEAAEVDGAGRFQKILHITVPGLVSTFVVLLVLGLGNVLSGAGFEQYYVFGNAMVLDKLEVIDTYTYKMGIVQGNYAFGTAMSMMKSVLSVGLLLIANFIVKKVRGSSIF